MLETHIVCVTELDFLKKNLKTFFEKGSKMDQNKHFFEFIAKFSY